ncbi:hypothetical protein [Streptomyces mexicanus]|uniref:hypothetical protein n=1 Tax=Streptomyces mexicanus TaxID=178566 RepID=UPI003686D676
MDTGMGDHFSDSVSRPPRGTGTRARGTDEAVDVAALERALAGALHADALDAAARRQALAAFRAARDEGLHRAARTRGQDDWSPRRAARRSLRAAVATCLAGLTLGGVSIAAIGLPGASGPAHGDAPAPRHASPAQAPGAPEPTTDAVPPQRAASPTGGPAAAADGRDRDRPPTAQDTQAHCRAYPSVKDRGDALDAPAWRRFLEAAGGEDGVAAYCAARSRPKGSPPGAGAGRTAAAPADRGPAPRQTHGQAKGRQ